MARPRREDGGEAAGERLVDYLRVPNRGWADDSKGFWCLEEFRGGDREHLDAASAMFHGPVTRYTCLTLILDNAAGCIVEEIPWERKGAAMFCQRCGGPTVEREVDGRVRPVCEQCGAVTYLDPKVAVAVVIGRAGTVLLGLRAANTRNPGTWSFPAGFVERGEEVEDAAVREAREETGMNVKLGPLLGVWSATGEAVVLLAYGGYIPAGHEPVAGDDLDRIAWWPLADLPPLSFPHDHEILTAWRTHNDAIE